MINPKKNDLQIPLAGTCWRTVPSNSGLSWSSTLVLLGTAHWTAPGCSSCCVSPQPRATHHIRQVTAAPAKRRSHWVAHGQTKLCAARRHRAGRAGQDVYLRRNKHRCQACPCPGARRAPQVHRRQSSWDLPKLFFSIKHINRLLLKD